MLELGNREGGRHGAARTSNVSRARHRHVVGEGPSDRRRSARGRRSFRPAQRVAPPSAVERAEPGRLVRRRRGGGRGDPPSGAVRLRGARGSRPLGANARRDPLDANDKPLRPAILWNDVRSFAECAELKRRVPDVEKRTGNLVMPGFTAPKMLWVAAHEPEVAKATKRVLLPKDYVRLRLSGEAVSEMSDASGTSWLDVGRRRWDEDLLAATGLSLAAMPGLVEGSEVSAYLSPAVAKAWGLEGRKIPIAGGGGDNAASAIGVGATAAGIGFRLARHVGRRLLRHRPLRQPARAHAARLLPRAPQSLARHVGDAVGGRGAVVDRRRPRTRARHRRSCRERGSLRPLEERRRLGAGLPALPQRRAHARTTTPRRPACSPDCAPATAPTRSSSR